MFFSGPIVLLHCIMMKDNFETTKKINGPLAAYRMEGMVNGKPKVLYLFADQHVMTHRCPDAVSLDIDQHIVREFNKINNSPDTTEYDLFVETYPDIVIQETSKATSSYLSEFRIAFSKYIDFDKETNKMTISKFGKKSRLHYIDIRNNMIFDIVFEHSKDTLHGFQIFDRNILKMSITNTITKIAQLLTYVRDYGVFAKKSENKIVMTEFINKSYDYTKSDEYLKKIIHKIINVYSDEKTKSILQKYIANILLQLNESLNVLIDMLKKMEEFWVLSDSMSGKLNSSEFEPYGMPYNDLKIHMDEWSNIYNNNFYIKFLNSASQIMDLYFLRRFIDKAYVTNGIVYTGAYHTMDIIHILIHEFNFKLTHSSVSKQSIPDLNKNIKNIKYDNFYLGTKKILFPDIFGQCVDMTGFPESYK